MKLGQIEKAYALILLVIFGGIVLHAPFSVFFGTVLPGAELLIKSWKEILLLAALPFGIVLVTRKRLWDELLKDRLMQLISAYVALHVLMAAAVLTGPLATVAGLMIDLRYVLFFMLVYVLMKVAPRYRHLFLRVGAVGAAIVVGFAVLQIFLPPDILKHIGYGKDTIEPFLTVDENRDFIRVNSVMRGPNPLGAYVVIVISLLAAAFSRGVLKLDKNRETRLAELLAVCSAVALWVSYSRSALGAAFVAAGIVGFVALRHKVSRRTWILGTVVLFALAGGLFAGRESTFVSNVVFHENAGTGATVNSNEDHVESLKEGVERMLRQPIGAGVGSTGSASLLSEEPFILENQYLFIAHEVGWLGLVLFVSLFLVVLLRLWRARQDWLGLGVLASGIGLALIGMVLPVWADDTVSIVWWGLAAIAIGTERKKHGRRQTKQKTA